MEFDPIGRVEDVKVAIPLFTIEEPSGFPLFKNVTVPVTPTGVTLAVKVTL
jgi:hypothetical protein